MNFHGINSNEPVDKTRTMITARGQLECLKLPLFVPMGFENITAVAVSRPGSVGIGDRLALGDLLEKSFELGGMWKSDGMAIGGDENPPAGLIFIPEDNAALSFFDHHISLAK